MADTSGARSEAPGARIQFVTGAGGAGRTTVAAATAQAAARRGVRTALVTEAGEAVAALGPLGAELVAVDTGTEFRTLAGAWQRSGSGVLDHLGAQPLDDDELTELPGTRTLAVLRALRAAVERDGHELVVVDLPPVADAVRMLALPGQLRRYLARLLPPERQAARALRPVLAQLAGVPLPARRLYEGGERAQAELALVQELVEGRGSSAVLVVDPAEGTAAAVAAARAGLALGGIAVETVFAGRMLPGDSEDSWLAALADGQRQVCKELTEALGPLPLIELPHLGRPVRDAADLGQLGVPAPGPAPRPPRPQVEDRLAEDGELVWRLPLPGAVKERLELVRRGDEVIVTVGPYRRALPLTSALRRCTVRSARLAGPELSVRFAPDPALWPEPG